MMDNNEILDSDLDLDFIDDKVELESISNSKFTILYILSLGLYGPWWMYKTWKYYKEIQGLDIMPVARAIFGIFFIYSLFEKIQKDAKSKEYQEEYSSGGLFTLFFVSNLMSRLPDPLWLASFLGLFSFYQPLAAFNWAVDKSSSHMLSMPNGFNSRQLVIVVLGSIFWVLIAIGLLLPEEGM